MERRNFIKQCGTMGVACVGLSALLESCKTTVSVPNTATANKIQVKKLDFAQNKFVLVNNQRLEAPIYLYKHNENEYSAVLMLCTHNGCELNVAGENLACPCHGAEFSNVGKVLAPPADKDLRKYQITTDQENIYIQL